jgi:hypothetical protein
MTVASIALAAAPPRTGGGFHVSTAVLVIVVIVALLGVLAIVGWRVPDRSPGADTQRERERIED